VIEIHGTRAISLSYRKRRNRKTDDWGTIDSEGDEAISVICTTVSGKLQHQ